MTLLSAYGSPEEIRATLGVGRTELNDAVLSLPMHVLQADLALDDIDVGVRPLFVTISNTTEGSRSMAEQRYYDLIRLFSMYAIAKNLVNTAPMFSAKRLTDGRAEFERNNDYYADLRDGIDSSLLSLSNRVKNAYAALNNQYQLIADTALVFTVLSPLNTDPVTG